LLENEKQSSGTVTPDEKKPEVWIVKVYNTLSGRVEPVEVSKAVYDEYRRDEWRTEKRDGKEEFNTIPFSSLRGSDSESYESFHEFADEISDPFFSVIDKIALIQAIKSLKKEERDLVYQVCFKGVLQKEYAQKNGLSPQRISQKLTNIKRKVKKYLSQG